MATIMWIVLADVVICLFFIYRYRQQLGLTVNGWDDKSTLQAKAGGTKDPPSGRNATIDGGAKRHRIVTGDAAAVNRAARAERLEQAHRSRQHDLDR